MQDQDLETEVRHDLFLLKTYVCDIIIDILLFIFHYRYLKQIHIYIFRRDKTKKKTHVLIFLFNWKIVLTYVYITIMVEKVFIMAFVILTEDTLARNRTVLKNLNQ